MRNPLRRTALLLVLALLVAPTARGQQYGVGLTLPPSGENQKASVSQWIGLVKLTVDYNSPNVTGPSGEDRRGKIWGDLVPYGMVNLSFGTCQDCPWRAGANENTVFTTSHDVQVEGQALPAGSYGLHMIPGEEEWTVIFSKDSRSWGSYFYDPSRDQLRVTVKPRPAGYHEWLTYAFTDRQPAQATVALMWENLQVPLTITVPNLVDLYVANMRDELRSDEGFHPWGWQAAAQYALQHNTNLKEALAWAERAAGPQVGQETFTTLQTLARAQAANGLTAESEQTLARALSHPTANVIDLHMYARQLQAQGRQAEAMKVYELNASRHPDAWPVNLGLARGHSALGRYQEALKYARLALTQAPDEGNRRNIEAGIQKLEAGQDMN